MRTEFPGMPFLIFGICILLTACNKKEDLQIDSESQSIVDHAIADQEFMSLPAVIYQHLSKNTSAGGTGNSVRNCSPCKFEGGDTIYFDAPARYSLDMQHSACSLNDGKGRSGSLSISISTYLNDLGCRTFVQLHNYVSGGWSYTCDSIVMISTGVSGAYNAYKVNVYNGWVRRDGYEIRYTCDRQAAVYSDLKAPGNKAMTSFFGTSQGINRVGLAFHTEVKTDIVKPNDCAFFNAGSLIISPAGYKERTVDFGAGECDEMGSFAVSENTVAFKLK